MSKKKTMAPSGSSSEGNTSQASERISASKNWCFTLNNYEQKDIDEIIKIMAPLGTYIFGEEVGENGTPHLQGFVCFDNKSRPMEKFRNKRIHWEKTYGNLEQNIKYCSKGINIKTNMDIEEPLIDPLKGKKYYDYQQEIINLLKQDPDERTIYWYYEEKGKTGKSSFIKHILINNRQASLVSGKGADIKYNLLNQLEERKNIKVVFIDVPRVSQDYVSYSAMEEIKNGMIVSGKYESRTKLINPPHLIVFSNAPPDTEKMSEDRWVIKEITL